MKINKNHIQLIAAQIKLIRDQIETDPPLTPGEYSGAIEALDRVSEQFAVELAKHNDGFERSWFLRDCGVAPTTSSTP